MRLLLLTIVAIVWVSGSKSAEACSNSCAPSSASWWRFLIYPFVVALVIYLWRWWTIPPAGVAFDPDDPEKIAAEREARRTLPLFWQAFDNPAPDECDFAVKFNLTPHKDAEFIWAHELKKEDGILYGKLGNEPLEPGYEPDRYYRIDPNLIVDWTYFQHSEAKGHFTTKLMFNRMPKRFVKKAVKDLGWSPI